jgi:EAL domain-containing protein (putative c-di-GMP-specific phosphodiesterase class I)
VQIAIDDFGTGYSSLNYLKRLPVNEIKIDKSFIHEMTENSDDASIVNSIIQLANSMGLKIVAEGVENEKTISQLTQLGCDMAQGYYYSKPVAAEQVAAVIDQIETPERVAVR